MKYVCFLVLLVPVIIFILLEFVFFYPKLFYSLLVLANLFVLITIFLFFRRNELFKSWKYYIGEAVLPVCFLSSVSIYSSMIISGFFVQLLFVIMAVFVYFYLRNSYYFFTKLDFCNDRVFKNTHFLGNFFVFFFAGAAIYGLQSFLNLSVWLLMIFLTLVIFLMVYQMMWFNKIDSKDAFVYVPISTLILLEIGWTLTFLPLNYNALGLSLAICYYVLMGLMVSYLKNILVKRTIKLYLIFGFLSIALIVLSSRWM